MTREESQRLNLPERTVSGLYVRAMVDILGELGVPEADCLSALNVKADALLDPRMRLPDTAVRDMYEVAERHTGNVMIGLETGYRFRVANFTHTGNVLAYCPNLRVAAEVNARYSPLAETAGLSELASVHSSTGDRHMLRWTPAFADDEGFRHLTEMVLGGYATTVRWLGWAMEGRIPSVSLRHARPEPTATMSAEDIERFYLNIFQCRPDFRALHNDVTLPLGSIDTELPTHSPTQLRRQRDRLDAVMFAQPVANDQSGRLRDIRAVLRAGLSSGVTTRDSLAKATNMTVRALDRLLSANGLKFSTLREQVRSDGFDELAARGLKLTEIAHELGYNDQAALTKAYKRWHGTTPGRHRSAL